MNFVQAFSWQVIELSKLGCCGRKGVGQAVANIADYVLLGDCAEASVRFNLVHPRSEVQRMSSLPEVGVGGHIVETVGRRLS